MMPIFNEIVEVSANVYRNMIGVYHGFDEFDDLTSDADTKKYAHRLITASLDKSDYQYQAIDYIFEQSSWLPTRFGTEPYHYPQL